jgi:CHAT domain-containing protein
VLAGDQLLGMVSALLLVGTSSVVASLLPVPDQTSIELMQAFHGALRRELPPASALLEARRVISGSDPGDPARVVTAAAFSCYGAG